MTSRLRVGLVLGLVLGCGTSVNGTPTGPHAVTITPVGQCTANTTAALGYLRTGAEHWEARDVVDIATARCMMTRKHNVFLEVFAEKCREGSGEMNAAWLAQSVAAVECIAHLYNVHPMKAYEILQQNEEAARLRGS